MTDPTAPPNALLRALEQAQTRLETNESSDEDSASTQTAPASPNAVIQRLKKGQWQRTTLIGGNRRQEGDPTERGTIQSISMDQVRFERDGTPSTVQVYKHDLVKEKPGNKRGGSNNNEQ